MADVGTTTAAGAAGEASAEGATGRRIRRQRSLPGGRAVVGALLVTAAAVATFAAYLNATADPTTSYLVAVEELEPGTRFASYDEVTDAFGSVTADLVSPLDERAIPVEEIESLVGRVLVAPMQRGDLVTRTAVVDDGGVAPAQTMSFPVPRTDAVGGTLRPGERVDVLATYGSGEGAFTAYVVRGVPLLGISAPDGGPASGASELILTVAVADLAGVQALGHAVNTADIFVTRSSATPDGQDDTPGAYRSEAEGSGPAPDPTVPSGSLEAPADADDDAPDADAPDEDEADDADEPEPDEEDEEQDEDAEEEDENGGDDDEGDDADEDEDD